MSSSTNPPSNPQVTTAARRDSLLAAAKVGALFAVTLFATLLFAGGWAAIHATPVAAQPAESSKALAAAFPRLAKDTEERLHDAIEPQVTGSDAPVFDPFVDRAGLTKSTGGATVPAVTASAPRVAAAPRVLAGPPSAMPTAPTAPAIPDFNSRFTAWQRGGQAPLSSLFSYRELQPIGLAGSGSAEDALFYAEPLRRAFAAPLRTQFYDAVLASIAEDGVVFKTNAGATVKVNWTRANRTKGGAVQQPGGGQTTPLTMLKEQRRPAPPKSDALQEAVAERYRPISAVPNAGQPAPQPAAPEKQPAATEETAPAAAPAKAPTAPKLPSRKAPALPTAFASFGGHGAAEYVQNASFVTTSEEGDTAAEVRAEEGTFSLAQRGSEHGLDTPQDVAAGSKVAGESAAVQEKGATPAATPAQQRPTVTEQQAAPAPKPAGERTDVAANTPKAPATAAAPVATPAVRAATFCQDGFRSEPYTFKSVGSVTLGEILADIHYRFGVNFIPDNDVEDMPVNPSLTNVPWGEMLDTFMSYNDLVSRCLPSGAIQIAKRAKLALIDDQRRKSAPIETDFIKLRYLQPTSGGSVDVTGRSQNPAGNAFEKLENAIKEILRRGGDNRGSVAQVPGRNELFLSGTRDQLDEIRKLIARADRPSYQVLLQALVYTANENKLTDVGVQPSVVLGTGDLSSLGGFLTQANSQNGSNGGSSGTGTGGSTTGQGTFGQPVPGGVRTLGPGFSQPTAGLQASAPNSIFGLSTTIGTAQFSLQATLLQQKGIINVQSRPFAQVADGSEATLNAGRQIPVLVPALVGGATGQTSGDVRVIEAGSVLNITPQVAEDEQGNPAFVTLQLRLENNDVDTSIVTAGGVPSVNRRSLQTTFRLKDSQTVVLGGFTADSVSDSQSRTPGLGSIPIIGNLFKRRVGQVNRDRLYFAISVRVVPQDAESIDLPVPSDATTDLPPAPAAQNPSPYQTKKQAPGNLPTPRRLP